MTKLIDAFFPPNGPCAFCGDEKVGARHRVIDSIAERVRAGDSLGDVAKDFEVSVDAALVAVAFVEGWDLGRKRNRKKPARFEEDPA